MQRRIYYLANACDWFSNWKINGDFRFAWDQFSQFNSERMHITSLSPYLSGAGTNLSRWNRCGIVIELFVFIDSADEGKPHWLHVDRVNQWSLSNAFCAIFLLLTLVIWIISPSLAHSLGVCWRENIIKYIWIYLKVFANAPKRAHVNRNRKLH